MLTIILLLTIISLKIKTKGGMNYRISEKSTTFWFTVSSFTKRKFQQAKQNNIFVNKSSAQREQFMKKTGILLLSLLLIQSLFAQENHRILLGFDFGGGTVAGELSNNWSIRQDLSSYSDYGNFSSGVRNESSIMYFSFKPELIIKQNRLSLLSGLRFTLFDSYLKGGINDDYFFLRYKSASSGTEFARISTLSETVSYLSIPLELKYVPIQISNVGFYAKVGTEAGVKLNSKKSIAFTSETMNEYSEEILNTNPTKINSMYSTIYGAFGVRWESLKGTQVNMEWVLPSQFLTKNNLSQITPEMYSGFQLSVMFPLQKTK